MPSREEEKEKEKEREREEEEEEEIEGGAPARKKMESLLSFSRWNVRMATEAMSSFSSSPSPSSHQGEPEGDEREEEGEEREEEREEEGVNSLLGGHVSSSSSSSSSGKKKGGAEIQTQKVLRRHIVEPNPDFAFHTLESGHVVAEVNLCSWYASDRRSHEFGVDYPGRPPPSPTPRLSPLTPRNSPLTPRKKHFDEEMTMMESTLDPDLVSPKEFLASAFLKTLFYILVWYTFGTGLTLYNKLLLGADLGNFPAPLLMNTMHFSMQAVISTFIVRYCCRSTIPPVQITWRDYFFKVFPTALATALDIDLSNASLVFISVTFATMCKSSAPVFLLLFAFMFKLESPSVKLLGIISVISVGVLLTVSKETQFDIIGFMFVMLSALMSGLRWTAMQIFLQKEEYGLNNPFAMMSYLTPIMAVMTGAFSLVFEPWHKIGQTRYFDTSHHVFQSCLLMLLGGALAFFMVLAEYLLVSETSALTLMVAGVVKEVVTVVVAIFFFHDEFTLLKSFGLVIIIIGVSLFNWYKYQRIVHYGVNDHAGSGPADTYRNSVKYIRLTENNADTKCVDTEDIHLM